MQPCWERAPDGPSVSCRDTVMTTDRQGAGMWSQGTMGELEGNRAGSGGCNRDAHVGQVRTKQGGGDQDQNLSRVEKEQFYEEAILLSLSFIPSYSQHEGQTLGSRRPGTLSQRMFSWAPEWLAAAALRAVCPSSALSSASLQESVDLGEIMFSLCYLPTAGRLTLTVIKCRNLKAMDITGYSGTSPPQVACHVVFQPPRH